MSMLGPDSVEVPDLPEPIRAVRFFVLEGDGSAFLLVSPQQYTVWPPRFKDRDYVTAECRSSMVDGPEVHDCPTDPRDNVFHPYGSGCGIYAYKTLEDVAWDWPLQGIYHRRGILPASVTELFGVWAEVSLWGKVFEHGRGYRAEFARVEALFSIKGAGTLGPDMLEMIADYNGVPVVHLDDSIRLHVNEAVRIRETTPPNPDDVLADALAIVGILARAAWDEWYEKTKLRINDLKRKVFRRG
jgi:hypothetical protein